jgi:hypothetical protein
MKICEYLNNYVIIRLLEIMDTRRVGIVIEGFEKYKDEDASSIDSILTDSTIHGNITLFIYYKMKLRIRNIKLPYLLIYTTVYNIYIPSTSKNVKLASLSLEIEKAKNIPRYIYIISGE